MFEKLFDGIVENERPDELTPDPVTLMEQAQMPASVAYVNRVARRHRETCPAVRWTRRATIIMAFVLGALTVTQAVAILAGKSIIRDTVREAVREELTARAHHAKADPGLIIRSALADEER